MELIVPTDPDDRMCVTEFRNNLLEICEARNNNAQLTTGTKANQKGYFDTLSQQLRLQKQTNRRPSGMEKQRRRRHIHTEPNSTHMDPTHPNPASLRRKHPTMENKPTKLRRTTLRRNHAPILHEPDSMPIRSTKSRQNAKQLQHGPQRIQNGARRYWRVKPCGL